MQLKCYILIEIAGEEKKMMKIRDSLQAVDLLYKEWNLGKIQAKADGKICAWVYLMEVLEESEQIVTIKEGKRLVGFCGYAKYNSRKHVIEKSIYHFIKKILLSSPKIKDKKALKQYLESYDYTPKELEDYFDGEISILIVNKKDRGKGLGKKLLEDTFELAKKDNIRKLQILTDGACNFQFYEFCGCSKIYETIIIDEIMKENEKGYIYEKSLISNR